MKAKFVAVPLVFLGLLSGCSSGPRVLERADRLGSSPDWARVTTPMFEEDGKKYFVGYVEVSGDSSRSGALNMADEKALSEPMRSLADQFLDQNQVGEDLRKDSAFGQRIISATRGFRVPMPTLQITKRYWETVQMDEYSTLTRAFALAEVSNVEYERAKQEYFARLRGNTEMRSILRDVGRKQREAILSPPPVQTANRE